MPADKFSPDGNPQDRAVVIDPTKYFPPDFTPVYGDVDEANATLDAVAKDTADLVAKGGTINQVLNTLLPILGTVLGATKIPIL